VFSLAAPRIKIKSLEMRATDMQFWRRVE
jgi:hypothetical protein